MRVAPTKNLPNVGEVPDKIGIPRIGTSRFNSPRHLCGAVRKPPPTGEGVDLFLESTINKHL